MQSDPLEQLLKRADAAARPPAVPCDLVRRSAAIVYRRRRARMLAGGAAMVLLIGGLTWWLLPHPPVVPHPPLSAHPAPAPADAKDLRSQIEQLRREAQWRMDLAMRLMREEKEARPALRATGFAGPIHEQVEYAAFTMVYQADRLSRQLGLPKSAEEFYRQCAEAFPQTHWGQVARQRLDKSDSGKEG